MAWPGHCTVARLGGQIPPGAVRRPTSRRPAAEVLLTSGIISFVRHEFVLVLMALKTSLVLVVVVRLMKSEEMLSRLFLQTQ